MSGGLDPHYDFALLGTSLPISILSAALSRAGFSILHIDEEEHYGGPWASLTLTELLEWSRNTSLHRSQGRHNVSISFPAFQQNDDDTNTIPQELMGLNRHFAISLVPTIVPCAGPTIDVLIRSKVASYCTFRLLQKTAVYDAEQEMAGKWPMRKVPASKEDIFKDKDLSLIDKRKLMKLLQKAAGANDAEAATTSQMDEDTLRMPFVQYLTSEEGPNLSASLAANIAYGVALCSSDQDATAIAMERIRRHITSIGRYGNAAYLVGQYGGAGEMAQCFCRASAVQGGTFVLGHRITQCSKAQESSVGLTDSAKSWTIALEGIEGGTQVDHIVADEDLRRRCLPNETTSNEPCTIVSVSGILLLDRGLAFDQASDDIGNTPPETGLLVFPPEEKSLIGAVTALQMAEGTFSCPKGMYLIYLSATVNSEDTNDLDARVSLRGSRDRILKLARKSKSEWKQEGVDTENGSDMETLLPLMECYYSSSEMQEGQISDIFILSIPMHASSIATSLDEATIEAEKLFWHLVGSDKRALAEEARKKRKPVGYTVGRGLGGILEGSEKEVMYDFFPDEEGDGEEVDD